MLFHSTVCALVLSDTVDPTGPGLFFTNPKDARCARNIPERIG